MTLDEVVYESVKDRVSDKEAFLSAIRNYQLKPVLHGGQIAGVLMRKGSEVHAAMLPEFHRKWFKKWIFSWLNAILREEGTVTTTCMSDHELGKAFAQRMGFVKVGESGNLIHYELKGPKC